MQVKMRVTFHILQVELKACKNAPLYFYQKKNIIPNPKCIEGCTWPLSCVSFPHVMGTSGEPQPNSRIGRKEKPLLTNFIFTSRKVSYCLTFGTKFSQDFFLGGSISQVGRLGLLIVHVILIILGNLKTILSFNLVKEKSLR